MKRRYIGIMSASLLFLTLAVGYSHFGHYTVNALLKKYEPGYGYNAHFMLPGDWFQAGDSIPQTFPRIVNLRMDPFKDHVLFAESPMSMRWGLDKLWAFVPMQAVVGQFLQTFQEFPQRQKSASFNVDQVLKQLEQGAGTGK